MAVKGEGSFKMIISKVSGNLFHRSFSIHLTLMAMMALVLFIHTPGAVAAPILDQKVSDFLSAEQGNRSDTDSLRVILQIRSLQTLDSFRSSDENAPQNRGSFHSGKVAAFLKNNARLSQTDIRSFLATRGRRKGDSILNIWAANSLILTLDRQTLAALAEREDVESIEAESHISLPPDRKGSAQGPRGNVEWSVALVNADKTWNELGITGKGVTLGIIDTGIFADHPDLKGKVTLFRDFSKNAEGEAVAPYDDQGHGTHCAGTICGGSESGTAIGVAPDARLVVGKSFTSSGSSSDGALMGAMQWMLDPDGKADTDDAPPLVSNSWGSSEQTSRTYWKIIEAWRAAGIFPLFAAGNSGPGAKTVGTPGGYPHSFAIGATNNRDGIASFSSRGPIVWDGEELVKPNVSAPGENIRSAGHRGGYTTKSGTSMATPNVAGVIALLLSAEPSLSIDDIWRTLEETTDDLGDRGRDNIFGTGRVDAFRAAQRVLLGGKVTGKVADSQGAAIEAAIHVLPTAMTGKCAADGSYGLVIPEGEYELSFRCYGFMPVNRKVKVVRKQTLELNITMEKAPTAKLKVSISDASGEAVAAKVTLLNTPQEPVDADAHGAALLEAPLGIYQVMTSAFGFATKITDNVKIGQNSETLVITMDRLPSLLVVDQTDKAEAAATLKKTLDSMGRRYSWLKAGDGVTAQVLTQYPMVMWFTGNSYRDVLGSANQADLTAYVKAGGNLLVAGADVGYCIKSSSFMSEILSAKFLDDNARSTKITGSGELQGLTADISGDTTSLKQSYPDALSPINGGRQAAAYDNGKIAAIASDHGSSRVLYMGVCISGIKGLETRTEAMNKAIEWLYPDVERAVTALARHEDSDRANTSGQTMISRALTLILSTDNGIANFRKVMKSLTESERLNLSALQSAVLEYESASK
ncbi:MAG: hypothetical protein CVV64_13730 [Candidatus Wallbacteria bacterium HGW-Wallbacteria-1]|jgi:hypothetical protein|uniref:Peptidase S8/S53 domain-containing protein n=1 Tax=Candidatus Wallbacteria bacterium HGW-Wallbacteria-1 TaxID=2013854 RepID=A0A2N1PMG0_9BACT|nr:MAG: hypothetical protein CVV64_13730 [Candidatus Wallbacteria bacterium HGW-Wallbacteria-1]